MPPPPPPSVPVFATMPNLLASGKVIAFIAEGISPAPNNELRPAKVEKAPDTGSF